MSDFLEKLKKAADEGEFNSDAAKKILEINELADKKMGKGTPEDLDKIKESLEKRYEGKVEAVTEEKALELNSEYEQQMEKFKKQDAINAQLATLMEIEDMVKLSIGDMFTHVKALESTVVEDDPLYADLSEKIEEIKKKYESLLNN